MLSRPLIRPIAFALAGVGAILAALAITYALVRAGQLPAFLPGHLTRHVGRRGHVPPTHAHVKLGFILALVSLGTLAAAWWVAFRYEPAD